MDKLRLGMKAKDELQPEMRDLVDTMNRLSVLPEEFEGKRLLLTWLTTMDEMQAADELSPEQIRQLLFELEAGYRAFNKALQ